MTTVREIKAELDAAGVKFPPKANKAYLKDLLRFWREGIVDPVPDEERPRNIKADRPDYIKAGDDFVDPNADPSTQA